MQLPAPNVFEILAQETLHNGLREAIKYLLRQLGRHQYLGSTCQTRMDEILLMIDAIMQYAHLSSFQGSFAEHFYGSRRIKLIETVAGNRSPFGVLSRRQMLISMIGLVVMPYIKAKLDAHYERMHYESGRLTQRERKLMQSYRWLLTSLTIIKVVMFARYAVGRSQQHDLMLMLAHLQLCSMGLVPNEEMEALEQATQSTWQGKLRQIVASTLARCLTAGAFYIQFLDFWHSRQASSVGNTELSPLPYPSAPSKTLLGMPFASKADATRCPLCHENRRNECALATSGYVFCYRCIDDHLKRSKTCPITGYPSSEASLIRLYPPSGGNREP